MEGAVKSTNSRILHARCGDNELLRVLFTPRYSYSGNSRRYLIYSRLPPPPLASPTTRRRRLPGTFSACIYFVVIYRHPPHTHLHAASPRPMYSPAPPHVILLSTFTARCSLHLFMHSTISDVNTPWINERGGAWTRQAIGNQWQVSLSSSRKRWWDTFA